MNSKRKTRTSQRRTSQRRTRRTSKSSSTSVKMSEKQSRARRPKLGEWIRTKPKLHASFQPVTTTIPVDCDKRDCCEKVFLYEVSKSLGTGQYGSVYKCKHKTRRAFPKAKQRGEWKPQTCSKYALKTQNSKKEWDNEIWALKLLNSEHFAPVPKLIDYWMCNGVYYMVMDRIVGERLYDLANKKQLANKKTQIIQLVADLREMNNLGVYHNDVHNKNFLWNAQKKQFVIIDFGWATHTPNNGPKWPDWKLIFENGFALDNMTDIKEMFDPIPATTKQFFTLLQAAAKSRSDAKLFENFLQAMPSHKKPGTKSMSFNLI